MTKVPWAAVKVGALAGRRGYGFCGKGMSFAM